jgi:aryl-alcohol dehydrogenase-like predicted oxidoreductase
VEACEASLRRLGTDYIDLYQAHNFDALTPLDETLRAFDDLTGAGKIRYAGCSNYSGWQLMKALSISDRLGIRRYISQQINYSLIARDAEHELVPAGLDQRTGIMAWSPLQFGLLSGKFRRGEAKPTESRRPASTRRARWMRSGSTKSSMLWRRSPDNAEFRSPRLRSTGSRASPVWTR